MPSVLLNSRPPQESSELTLPKAELFRVSRDLRDLHINPVSSEVFKGTLNGLLFKYPVEKYPMPLQHYFDTSPRKDAEFRIIIERRSETGSWEILPFDPRLVRPPSSPSAR